MYNSRDNYVQKLISPTMVAAILIRGHPYIPLPSGSGNLVSRALISNQLHGFSRDYTHMKLYVKNFSAGKPASLPWKVLVVTANGCCSLFLMLPRYWSERL